jgi:hypothetical protein
MNLVFDNARGISIRVTTEGQGCVNMDGSKTNQSSLLWGLQHLRPSGYSNDVFAKHVFTKTGTRVAEDGTVWNTYDIRNKVSKDTFRHEMFKDEMISLGLNAFPASELPSYLASAALLSRGFFLPMAGAPSLKRDTSFFVSDMVQKEDDKAVPVMENHSNEGARESKRDEAGTVVDESKDANFFKRENIGYHESSGVGFIDLTKLQTVICDPKFGRAAINESMIFDFLEALKAQGVENPEIGYFKKKKSPANLGEKMILLPDSHVTLLVRHILGNMLNVNFFKVGGFFRVKKLEICQSSSFDPYGDHHKWITVDEEVLNSLTVQVASDYVRIPDAEAQAYNAAFKAAAALQKEKSVANKKNKAKADAEAEA